METFFNETAIIAFYMKFFFIASALFPNLAKLASSSQLLLLLATVETRLVVRIQIWGIVHLIVKI